VVFCDLCGFSRNNRTTPLDCWREVDKFKASVAEVERVSHFILLHQLPLLTLLPLAILQNTAINTTQSSFIRVINDISFKNTALHMVRRLINYPSSVNRPPQ
jgi:hypothetical protein